VLFNDEFPQRSIPIIIKNREFKITYFKLALYSTLFSLLFLIFKAQPLFGWDNWFINNSANLVVFGFSVTLTVFFFIWLDMVVLYNGKSTSILKNLIKGYDSVKNNSEKKQYYLKAINELTFYAIEKQDEHLQETLLKFYYKVFSSIQRKTIKDSPLEYPIDLYFLVNRLNIEAVNTDNKKLKAIEHRAVSGIWLLGEGFKEIPISEETYNWLWRNLYSICDEQRLVKMFWANSSEYFRSNMKSIYPNYDNNTHKLINSKEIDKRDDERNQFLEFHYALGGLILYRNQYSLLKYFFEYSQSQPPKYVLLPEKMTDIFFWFENIKNEFKNLKTSIDTKYYFPELDNLGNSHQVIHWICQYIAILFIRQYSLNTHYTYQQFTSLPSLPDDILELTNWLSSISFFRKCLDEVLNNDNLIAELGYSEIVQANSANFDIFIDNLEKDIKKEIGQKKLNAELDQQKIQQFYSRSNEILSLAFEEYKPLFAERNEEFENSDLRIPIYGGKTLMSKSAFTDGYPFLNYDSVFASAIAVNNIKQLIPNSFSTARTARYLFSSKNVLTAISKAIGNLNNVIIIGMNIGYALREIINESKFKTIIKYYPSTGYKSQDTLYILSKDDLPAIEYTKPKENTEKLELINEDLQIYASVNEINIEKNEEIELNSKDLDLKVELEIYLSSVIYWKNDRDIIQINITSEFEEQGIQNDINDIVPLRNK
jgi:hypothetical protein